MAKGKLLAPNNNDWTDRLQNTTDIRLRQWLTIWDGMINRSLCPGTFADEIGEELELANRTSALARQSRHRQRGLGKGALQQGIAQTHHLVREQVEELGARLRRGYAQSIEGIVCCVQGGIDLSGGRFAKGRLQRLAVARVDGLEGRALGSDGLSGDKVMSVQAHDALF